MGNKNSNIPVKVFVSYIALAILVVSVGWILYTENKIYSKIESEIDFEENKVLKISKLFSNVYETESLARKTIQSNSEDDFKTYLLKTDSLKIRLDLLKKIVSSNYQTKLLDSVTVLLSEKTNNIRQLRQIKNKTTDEASVKNAIQELNILENSLRKLKLQDFHSRPENLSKYQYNVLQNYVDYLNQNIPDDSSNTLTKKASDSILSASKRLLNDVKIETEKKKASLAIQEKKLINNEILISDQLRKVLHIIEREIIVHSLKNNNEREKSLKRINQIVSAAAIVGLLLTVFFSILITSDFSKTQLYKKQLEIANFKARNLLKSREQLISTVSHDLKTPLSTLAGYAELLSNSELTSKQSYFTNNIKNASEYISRLVKDLLDFSQLEAGKIKIEKSPFLLKETINEVAKNIQTVHQQKNIDLLITIDEKLNQSIIGDEFRLKQVIINIIGNAYKFTQQGFIAINATLDATKNIVFISITDSGIGIEKASQNLIFEEFTQANESIEKTFGGTGLGLSISKKIIALLGGELYLKESSKNGSCFEIKLPVTFAKSIDERIAVPTIYIPIQKNKTIVVIDDDANLLQLTTEVLKQYHTVLSFSNAQEALDEIRVHYFDLLITDIQMPIMDGFEFVKAIQGKENENYKNQPIIAVTGRTDLSDETYKKAGFTVVLNKPFTPNILLETIDAIFSKTSLPVQDKTIVKTQERLFSLASLHLFLNNDAEAVKNIIESLIHSTDANITELENNIEKLELQKIKEVAHKMAPIFKQIEAKEVALILTQLESQDFNSSQLKEHLSHLKSKTSVLFVEIKKAI